ncbi:MAG: FHA domain-containing protein [Myxococcota bacterium]
MPRFVDLVVLSGPETGMRYTVETGTYRVIGRAGDDHESTLQLSRAGDRLLDAEQQAVVESVLNSRADRGVRTRIKRRGPDILLGDGSVSRTHALVFVDESGTSVADLMSTNGTKVNGTLVTDIDVEPGDVLQVGQSRLRVDDD